jgi:hypothetical protein
MRKPQMSQSTIEGPDESDKNQIESVIYSRTIQDLDAFEEEQKKAKPMLACEVGLIFRVVILYVAARGYMVIEVFVSLSELSLEAY